ncbi:MAG: plasmid encoded RepA protein, partial [Bryobacterales bacterium]|nr:plasmid encoded RepA protein [Bryobacterales bacterium]
MLRHSGDLAREPFQDILAQPAAASRIERKADAVVVREKRESGVQDLAFGARPFILCGLPIHRLPAGDLTYTRRNGRFFLEIVGHPEFGVPFGQ